MPAQDNQAIQETASSQIAGDRRAKKRYALDLIVVYRTVEKWWPVTTGIGRTTNMSSGGIVFTTDRHLTVGTAVELSISWPVLLNHNCPLKLVIEGKVVRSSNNYAAIKFKRHEFRTQGKFGRLGSTDT